jgi:hypothetical protein
MTPYRQALTQVVTNTLPRYSSVSSVAKLLVVETLAIAYGKLAGEVARDLLAIKETK